MAGPEKAKLTEVSAAWASEALPYEFVAQPPQQKDRGDGFCRDGFECDAARCSLKHPFGLRRKHFQLTVVLNGSSEAYSALVDAMGPGTVDLWERFLHVTVAYVDLECPFDTRGTLCPEDKKFLKPAIVSRRNFHGLLRHSFLILSTTRLSSPRLLKTGSSLFGSR